MKYLLLLIPFFSFGQNAPKKSNTIVVHNVTLKEAANILLDKGYEIEKIDSNLNTIKTAFKESTRYPYGWSISIIVRIKEGVAIIKGLAFMKVVGEYPVENRGMKNSWLKSAFIAMNDFALSFNKAVEYKTEEL